MQRLYAGDNYDNIFDLLIKNGTDVNAKDNNGKTVIWFHINDYKVCKLLIKYGAKLNVYDNSGKHLIFEAVNGYEEKVLPLLIENGININERDKIGRTILFYLAEKGSPKKIKLLLKNKVDINIIDKNGQTPLHRAMKNYKNFEIVKLLIENGAKIYTADKIGMTPLMYAALFNKGNSILYLIKRGANIRHKNIFGKNAFYYYTTMIYGNDNAYEYFGRTKSSYGSRMTSYDIKIIKALYYDKIDLNDSQIFQTPIIINAIYRIEWSKYDLYESVKFLIDKGADILVKNKFGFTPFLMSALNTNWKFTKLFLDNGANINDVNKKGETAIQILSKRVMEKSKLLEYKNSKNRDSNLKSRYLSHKKTVGFIKLLCEYAKDNHSGLKNFDTAEKILINKGYKNFKELYKLSE